MQRGGPCFVDAIYGSSAARRVRHDLLLRERARGIADMKLFFAGNHPEAMVTHARAARIETLYAAQHPHAHPLHRLP